MTEHSIKLEQEVVWEYGSCFEQYLWKKIAAQNIDLAVVLYELFRCDHIRCNSFMKGPAILHHVEQLILTLVPSHIVLRVNLEGVSR